MVKAKFIGDANNENFQCDKFNASIGNVVSMPNESWEAIVKEKKDGLFSVISNDNTEFPAQRTIG